MPPGCGKRNDALPIPKPPPVARMEQPMSGLMEKPMSGLMGKPMSGLMGKPMSGLMGKWGRDLGWGTLLDLGRSGG